MGLFLGMDEAGYGPNLGPLVVTATVWQVPDQPVDVDFWQAFAKVLTRSTPIPPTHLHIDDSKRVYQSSRGLGSLEKSVLCTLRLLGWTPDSFDQLCTLLQGEHPPERPEPWFDGADLPLPESIDAESVANIAERWSQACQSAHIRLLAVRSDVVLPKRFNDLVRQFDNKSQALSHISFNLLRRVWDPDTTQPTLVVADKHGGRNHYGQLLAEILDDRFFFTTEEGRIRSRYRVGASEVRFQMKAESEFPVAVASLVCKYVRELAMELFNRFWQQHVDGLKPTKGYPVDARRFKAEITEMQQRLGIPDEILWRAR